MSEPSRAGFTTPIIRRWDELKLRDPEIEEIIGSVVKSRPFDPADPTTVIGGLIRYLVPSGELIPTMEKLPDQLSNCQDASPTIVEFMEIAKKVPTAVFEVYVVCEFRPDERISIDGIRIGCEGSPTNEETTIRFL